jgi:hypothetical protein
MKKIGVKLVKKVKFIFFGIVAILCIIGIYQVSLRYINENRILKAMIKRLEADSRIAEVLVTKVEYSEEANTAYTTIKFLEYDTEGEALSPKYFTFPGNVIQFQSLVIRFEDLHVKNKDLFKERSAYLFWKVFMLDGKNTEEYTITQVNQIPQGYKVEKKTHYFEQKLWEKFWHYALNPEAAKQMGIKNAQIEAPGTTFIPGTLYTIKIEHDGGMRIDSSPLPYILKGEYIL